MQRYLIIGASKGIGLETANMLLTKGYEVIGISRSGSSITNPLYHDMKCDVLNDELPVVEGIINGMVYCPGSIKLRPFKQLKPKDFMSDLEVNLFGAIKCIQTYSDNLVKDGTGSITLFSTVAVDNGMAFHASVASAKGAVQGLTKSLAAEFSPKVRVNAIAPSLVETPLAEKLVSNEKMRVQSEERHPLKRIGQAEDISKAVEFLIENTWVTGQILHVDGGMSI